MDALKLRRLTCLLKLSPLERVQNDANLRRLTLLLRIRRWERLQTTQTCVVSQSFVRARRDRQGLGRVGRGHTARRAAKESLDGASESSACGDNG